MGAKLVFYDNARLNRKIEVWFTSDSQAMKFVNKYQNTGGICNFVWEHWQTDKTQSVYYVRNSEDLYKTLYRCLYEKELSWVGSLRNDKRGFIVAQDKSEYPTRETFFGV